MMSVPAIFKKMVGNGGPKLKPLLSEAAARDVAKLELRQAEALEYVENARRTLETRVEQQVVRVIQNPGSAIDPLTAERRMLREREAEAETIGRSREFALRKLEESRGAGPTEEALLSAQTRCAESKVKMERSLRRCIADIEEYLEVRTATLSIVGWLHALSEQPVLLLLAALRRLRLWLADPGVASDRWIQ